MLRGFDVVDEGPFRHAGQRGREPPVRAPVLRHVDEAVVAPRVDHARRHRRLGDAGNRRVLRHGTVVDEVVDAPHPPHELQLVAVHVRRQVAADRGPRVAPVVARPHALRAVVDAVGVVWADEDWRVPVPALGRVAGRGLRLDVERFLALPVVAVEVPLLRLQVEDVGIPRVDLDRVPVGPHRHVPVPVTDALDVGGAGRAPQRAEILRAAEHVVERLRVVERKLVELGDRHVREVPERPAVVEALVQPRVRPHEQVQRVLRVDPQRVVVAVFVARRLEVSEGRATVPRDLDEDVHLVHDVRIVRGGFDLLVVVRTGAAGDVRVPPLPALTLVERPVEAALVVVRLHGGVHDFGVRRGDGESDLSHIAARESGRDPAPALAAVGGLVDAGVGAAGEVPPDLAPTFVRRRVDHVRVAGGELDVGDAGVLVDLQHEPPGVAAVGGLVDAALSARGPERPLRRHEDDVAVARVDEDLPDVLRGGEPDVLPRLPAVAAAVDAVPPADVAPAHVLSRAHPDHVRVVGVDRDVADRVHGLVLEDRVPRHARVRRLPHAAGADRDVPRAAPVRMHGDVRDPATHQRGADLAQRETGDDLCHQRLIDLLGLNFRRQRGRCCRKPHQDAQTDHPPRARRVSLRRIPHLAALLRTSASGLCGDCAEYAIPGNVPQTERAAGTRRY